MSDKRVFLGMPGYGHISAGASRGFWRASREPVYAREYREGSLLAANFNGLWVNALNREIRGEPVTYFAMQHADVEPEDWWLDTLIAEMEARDLDVLGVAIPIKDTHGLTSLALAHPSGDPWRILCRLTLCELFRLPETFTSEDVGHPLLLNTGLWVCRFGPWARSVHFEITDRIVYNTKSNRYQAQCGPEDWNFSRQLHELGLRIGATRKVKVSHAGHMRFRNTHPWGSDQWDTAYVDASPIPASTDDGFRYPFDVEGWLSFTEGKALWELAKDRTVLEIGSYCGASTICLAQSARHVTAADPHDGRGTPLPKQTLSVFRSNLERYGVADRVLVHVGTADRVPGDAAPPFDLAFIDGAHDYAAVRSDIEEAVKRLKPGGLLAFHDYRSAIDPDVTRAVDELLASGGELISTHDTLAVVRPPASVPLEV